MNTPKSFDEAKAQLAAFAEKSHAAFDRSAMKQKMLALSEYCNEFKGADTKRSIQQLSLTAALFIGTLVLIGIGLHFKFWPAFLLSPIAAGLLVRMFIFQHDCGHGSYFKTRRANDHVGRIISIFTLTPYAYWKRAHAIHHATSGNLERRGVGDIETLTVAEYNALSRFGQWRYRLYRNPLILLVIGAPFLFVFIQRSPLGQAIKGRDVWLSVMGLNLTLILAVWALGSLIGFGLLAMIYVPVIIIGAWIGGWMFFIQHQFEGTYWQHNKEWDFHSAAVLGSSYYVLPKFFQWFSGNIGLHHIHHLCGKIPNYRLQECLDGSELLQNINRLTFIESLKTVRLALWDEAQKKLVSFRQLKMLPAPA